jgi:formyl-CoA transferase
MSGSAQLTGDPNGPPGHVGYSLADTLAGLMGAYGILLALIGRARDGAGECIDLALYEPLFRLIDWQVIVYDQLGMAPVRAGNGFPEALEGVAAGVAKTSDGVWMSYSAATDSVLSRLIEMIYSKPLDSMDEFASAELRRRQCRDIEERLDAWIEARTAAEVEATFAEHDAVVGRVYDMADIWTDPTYRERDNIISVADPDYGAVSMHGVVPKLVTRPGVVQSVGEPLGAHTSQVLRELADLDDDAIADLMKQGVI